MLEACSQHSKTLQHGLQLPLEEGLQIGCREGKRKTWLLIPAAPPVAS